MREDYSENGDAWSYFPFSHSHLRAYRWGEDGLLGISDRNQYLCFAPAFWNGKDPIIKERLFGLAAPEGNHGEDIKELFFYLDSTPTHSYMKALYKYPIQEFPYGKLVEENGRRSRLQPEYEIAETGVFDRAQYFDCLVEYAKSDEEDILIRMTVTNRSGAPAELYVMPQLWFRNTWSWGYPRGPMGELDSVRPWIRQAARASGSSTLHAAHCVLGDMFLVAADAPGVLFTENDTNNDALYRSPNHSPFTKDSFNRYLVQRETGAVNPANEGTKAAFLYHRQFAAGEQFQLKLRLCRKIPAAPFEDFDLAFAERIAEADGFYEEIIPSGSSEEERMIQRQAFAGLLWSKQLFYYDVEQWLKGDPALPPPPANRERNKGWMHLVNFDIISMPDKWEFPWYAAWDLAFHTVPLALVDPDFAKRQLELLTREWYMHPNGQLPAYEWAFSDVNPPVHAWAAWEVFELDARHQGRKDYAFLEGIFHKMLINFTWWVNRKDAEGNNIFQGGFLGLDNIGVFDRNAPLPGGGHIDQADGTSWMAAYCLSMLRISIELAKRNPVYQDTASKFAEHFLRVAHAMTNIGQAGQPLWDDQDGFFYDLLHLPEGTVIPLRLRSLVGLIPLFAVDTIEPETLKKLPDFRRRLDWFLLNRPHLSGSMARMDLPGMEDRRLVALLTRERLIRVLRRMFDESEFLSPYGIRSLSRYHADHPYRIRLEDRVHEVSYEPAESTTLIFGGNSNWRGPVWLPINYILIEALRTLHAYYGESLTIEYPTGSGAALTLDRIADDLVVRLSKLFRKGGDGVRPFSRRTPLFAKDPNFEGLLQFNEYFHPEEGVGLGASHQTGWTALIAVLLSERRPIGTEPSSGAPPIPSPTSSARVTSGLAPLSPE